MPHRTSRSRLGTVFALVAALACISLLASCTTTTPGIGTGSLRPSPSPSPSSSSAPAQLKLSDCSKLFNVTGAGIASSRLKNLTFSCGKVPVPLDYANPAGPMINIEVLRVRDTRQKGRIGSLLVNPGGPGQSGLTLPISLAATVSDDVLQHFDLVGFDPRGVGLSSPIDCVSDSAKDALSALDPDIRTPAGFATAKQAAATVATGCSTKYGATLADYNTVNTAKDLDRIRIALGDKQLNYLGQSYGTELGRVYAHLFPANIRVAVLDGAVDPTTDAITTTADQLQGFESAFDQFAADCLTRAACKSLGDPRQAVYSLVAKANTTPIPSSRQGETRAANGGIVLLGVLYALYNQSTWATLGDALIQAQKGDSRLLFALADSYWGRGADGTYSNLYEANLAIMCNDQPTGPSDATIAATATQWAAKYPMFGLWTASTLFACQDWQPDRTLLPPATATGSRPIVVIGSTHDPATPYAGAQNLTKALTTGVLLTWQGQGHTAYTKSTCIDTAVDSYLVTGAAPPVGTVCPA